MSALALTNWPSARHFAEAMQCPALCFSAPVLRNTLPAVDRLGMPLVTSGQFAYVYKLKPSNGGGAFAVRCFRGYLGDREQRYQAIDEHLEIHNVPALPSFEYDPEGILVNGRRFPILVMQWIEGPTLDVYLEEVIGRREVLLHLADEWVKLMSTLRDAGVAHGDLQHGNIIVERGQLRLVDLDGMFVPAMDGWAASEMGHQHYQHPARAVRLFNSDLDNFSSLAIYLSLISLAEKPELWKEHHDENLLFTKSDFSEPEASALFAKIKSIGPEQRKLAEVLEMAAKSDPARVPSLFEFVTPKSKLPSWMSAPPDIDVAGRTREALPVEVAPGDAGNQAWTPWQLKRDRTIPQTPPSAAVQSVFSTPASSAPVLPDPSDIGANAIRYAKAPLKSAAAYFYLWFLAWRGFASFWTLFGVNEFFGFILTIMLFVAGCLLYGLFRAFRDYEAHQASISGQFSAAGTTSLPPPPSSGNSLPSWATPHRSYPTLVYNPPTTTTIASSAIVGNRKLGIYHLPGCEWVNKISQQNRVSFSSSGAAQTAGYRQCQVCFP